MRRITSLPHQPFSRDAFMYPENLTSTMSQNNTAILPSDSIRNNGGPEHVHPPPPQVSSSSQTGSQGVISPLHSSMGPNDDTAGGSMQADVHTFNSGPEISLPELKKKQRDFPPDSQHESSSSLNSSADYNDSNRSETHSFHELYSYATFSNTTHTDESQFVLGGGIGNELDSTPFPPPPRVPPRPPPQPLVIIEPEGAIQPSLPNVSRTVTFADDVHDNNDENSGKLAAARALIATLSTTTIPSAANSNRTLRFDNDDDGDQQQQEDDAMLSSTDAPSRIHQSSEPSSNAAHTNSSYGNTNYSSSSSSGSSSLTTSFSSGSRSSSSNYSGTILGAREVSSLLNAIPTSEGVRVTVPRELPYADKDGKVTTKVDEVVIGLCIPGFPLRQLLPDWAYGRGGWYDEQQQRQQQEQEQEQENSDEKTLDQLDLPFTRLQIQEPWEEYHVPEDAEEVEDRDPFLEKLQRLAASGLPYEPRERSWERAAVEAVVAEPAPLPSSSSSSIKQGSNQKPTYNLVWKGPRPWEQQGEMEQQPEDDDENVVDTNENVKHRSSSSSHATETGILAVEGSRKSTKRQAAGGLTKGGKNGGGNHSSDLSTSATTSSLLCFPLPRTAPARPEDEDSDIPARGIQQMATEKRFIHDAENQYDRSSAYFTSATSTGGLLLNVNYVLKQYKKQQQQQQQRKADEMKIDNADNKRAFALISSRMSRPHHHQEHRTHLPDDHGEFGWPDYNRCISNGTTNDATRFGNNSSHIMLRFQQRQLQSFLLMEETANWQVEGQQQLLRSMNDDALIHQKEPDQNVALPSRTITTDADEDLMTMMMMPTQPVVGATQMPPSISTLSGYIPAISPTASVLSLSTSDNNNDNNLRLHTRDVKGTTASTQSAVLKRSDTIYSVGKDEDEDTHTQDHRDGKLDEAAVNSRPRVEPATKDRISVSTIFVTSTGAVTHKEEGGGEEGYGGLNGQHNENSYNTATTTTTTAGSLDTLMDDCGGSPSSSWVQKLSHQMRSSSSRGVGGCHHIVSSSSSKTAPLEREMGALEENDDKANDDGLVDAYPTARGEENKPHISEIAADGGAEDGEQRQQQYPQESEQQTATQPLEPEEEE